MSKNQIFISNTEELNQAIDKDIKIAVLTDGSSIRLDREIDFSFLIKGDIEANIDLLGGTAPRIFCTGKTKAQIISRGTSKANIIAKDYSEVLIRTEGRSSPNVTCDDLSRIKVLAHDNSSPFFFSGGSSLAVVVVHDHANPKGVDWPEEWKVLRSDIYIGQRLVCYANIEDAQRSAVNLYHEWSYCRNRFIACIRIPGAIPKICSNVVHFRFKGGLIHLELPTEDGCQEAWFAAFQELRNLTEDERSTIQRHYIR
jgi:hypothetical protein